MHINQFGNGGTGAAIVSNAFARLQYKYESRNNRNIYIAENQFHFVYQQMVFVMQFRLDEHKPPEN